MAKPKAKSNLPSTLLEVPVPDNEDFTTFCVTLLDRGYLEWLGANGRAQRLGSKGAIPLHVGQPWPVWRKLFTQVAKRWWEAYRDDAPKRHPRNMQDHCWRLIGAVIHDLAQGTTWTWDDPVPPPWKGQRLSASRLATLMSEKDPDPDRSIQMYRNYATLWFIYQRLATSTPLRPQDLTFLKRHDQNMYRIACFISQQSSPRN